MRTGISITLKPSDRRRLKALARDRNAPHKHVWRAEIVLFSADGVGTNEIMRRTGKSKTCVWRWQERFMQEGYDGLLRDKTRPSRIPRLGSNIIERVVTLTQTDPPAEATHWTSAMMAKVVDISAGTKVVCAGRRARPQRIQILARLASSRLARHARLRHDGCHPASGQQADAQKNQVERNAKTSDLIPWSIQEIRRIAQRLARKRIQPADVIAWSLWRRAHQAAAQKSHLKQKSQL
jgi:transposase